MWVRVSDSVRQLLLPPIKSFSSHAYLVSPFVLFLLLCYFCCHLNFFFSFFFVHHTCINKFKSLFFRLCTSSYKTTFLTNPVTCFLMTSLLYVLFSCKLPPITVEPHWYDPFRTISWCQCSRLRTQKKKMTQYSYASFLRVNTFLESTIFHHQRSAHHQTTIVWYATSHVNKKRHEARTIESSRHQPQ